MMEQIKPVLKEVGIIVGTALLTSLAEYTLDKLTTGSTHDNTKTKRNNRKNRRQSRRQ